jgi:predicted nucleic acid-binding Zn ribbon protein
MSLRRKEQTSNSAIKNLLKALGMEEKLLILEMKEKWRNIMGSPIANHTQRIFIDNETLYIQLDSSALRHELNYSQNKILAEITKDSTQTYFTKIKFI